MKLTRILGLLARSKDKSETCRGDRKLCVSLTKRTKRTKIANHDVRRPSFDPSSRSWGTFLYISRLTSHWLRRDLMTGLGLWFGKVCGGTLLRSMKILRSNNNNVNAPADLHCGVFDASVQRFLHSHRHYIPGGTKFSSKYLKFKPSPHTANRRNFIAHRLLL